MPANSNFLKKFTKKTDLYISQENTGVLKDGDNIEAFDFQSKLCTFLMHLRFDIFYVSLKEKSHFFFFFEVSISCNMKTRLGCY